VNAASFTPGIAPGGFATIMGTNLAAGQTASASTPFPTSLAGVVATINGSPVPLTYVSDTQVNFLTPANLLPGPVDLSVSNRGGALSVKATVVAYAPGIFFDAATGYGAVLISGT